MNLIRFLRDFFALGVIIGALPYTIQNGQQEDATPVMGNFNSLVNQINNNIPPLIPSLGTLTTFMPTILFGGGNTGMTYFAQTGYYINFGGFVFIQFRASINAMGSSTGAATIGGLPITVNASIPSAIQAGNLLVTSSVRFTGGAAGTIPAWAPTPNTKTLSIFTLTSSGPIFNLTDLDFGSASAVSGQGFYFT